MISIMKIINNKEEVLGEVLEGIMFTQPDAYIRMINEFSYILYRKNMDDKKVKIIASGGAGRGPLFEGFAGEGLADAVVTGDFNCAPNAYALYDVARTIDRGRGILFLTNNYAGDYLNNDMAVELLSKEGISSGMVLVSDDIFSARGEPKDKRGGLSGIGILIKIASAAAEDGLSLEEVLRITQKANDRIRTAAVCMNDDLDLMEFGAGFSGEAPVITEKFQSADRLAESAIEKIMGELDSYQGGRIYLNVNRMRQMMYVEGYVVLMSLKRKLEKKGYSLIGASVGGYYDAYDANGCIISLLSADSELEKYIKPAKGYDFTI